MAVATLAAMVRENSQMGETCGVQTARAGASVRLFHALWLGALTVLPVAACSAPGDGAGAEGGAGAAGAGTAGSAAMSGDPCEAQFDALERDCPVGADSRDANLEACREQRRGLAGIGCQAQYDAWLSCTTQPGYDCQQDTSCEGPQGGYFRCQSLATQSTGCVRLAAQDTERCSDAAKPYAFGCLAAAPTQCLQVVSEGGGIWCCPQL